VGSPESSKTEASNPSIGTVLVTTSDPPFDSTRTSMLMYKFNCTRQLHESIVVMWLCKCECRTHRESALSKTNFKVPKLIKSQPSSDFKHVACIK
jgi:hypothetical protein